MQRTHFDPLSGAQNRNQFRRPKRAPSITFLIWSLQTRVPKSGPWQGVVFYKWVDFLNCRLVLQWLNLDETWIPPRFVETPGNLVIRRRPPTHNVPLHLKRGGVTFIGLAAASRELQSVLPLIFIAGHRMLPVRAWRTLNAEAPPHLQVWRERPSWNSAALMEKILDAIAAQAARVLGPRDQLTLVMDCSYIHTCPRILQKARSLGIWYFWYQPSAHHICSLWTRTALLHTNTVFERKQVVCSKGI